VNRQHAVMIKPADDRADFGSADRLRTVNRDLRGHPQAILIGRRNIDPRDGGVLKGAGQRQDNDSGKRIEPVRLNDNGRTRLAAVPLQGNNDDIAAACQPRSSQASALTCSQNVVSAWPSSVLSDAVINSHWRRHSAAKPGARVSGTQIWIGRSPAARILSRRRLTRSALVSLFIAIHVAAVRRDSNVQSASANDVEATPLAAHATVTGHA